MRARKLSHAIGFDDAPFDRGHRGNVRVIGAVFAGERLDGVLAGSVRRDGANATGVLAKLIEASRFRPQLQIIFLQGIALAGFNVIDLQGLHRASSLPVLVVSRRRPDLAAMRRALLEHVPGGARKWRLVEQAGPMEPLERVFVQRVGLTVEEARAALRRFSIHSIVPEPLRAAHLVAGGLAPGGTRQRV